MENVVDTLLDHILGDLVEHMSKTIKYQSMITREITH
jgi:hypothetical protein